MCNYHHNASRSNGPQIFLLLLLLIEGTASSYTCAIFLVNCCSLYVLSYHSIKKLRWFREWDFCHLLLKYKLFKSIKLFLWPTQKSKGISELLSSFVKFKGYQVTGFSTSYIIWKQGKLNPQCAGRNYEENGNINRYWDMLWRGRTPNSIDRETVVEETDRQTSTGEQHWQHFVDGSSNTTLVWVWSLWLHIDLVGRSNTIL